MKRAIAICVLVSLTTYLQAQEQFVIEDLNEFTQSSVALISTDRSWGSGFFVTGKVVVTNHHIVSNAQQILVKLRHSEVSARVYWQDPRLDLAVVLLDDSIPGSRPVTLANNAEGPGLGSGLLALGLEGDVSEGFDLTAQVIPTPVLGNVTQLVDVYGWPWVKDNTTRDKADDLLMMQHSAQVSEGYSGGPIFDLCGRVIGVITMPPRGVEGINYASGIGELVSKLASERLLNRQLNRLVNKDTTACAISEIPADAVVAVAGEGDELDLLRDEIDVLQQTVSESVEARERAAELTQAYQEQMAELEAEITRSRQAEVVNQQALNDLTEKLSDLEDQNRQQLAVLQQSELKLTEAESSLAVANEALGEVQQEVATIERESQEERARLLNIVIIVSAVVLGLFLIALVLIASLRKKLTDAVIRAKDTITRVAARRGSGVSVRPQADPNVKQIRIGRGRDMEFRFESDAVSRFHAELEIRKGADGQPDTYHLADVGSANGLRILRDERWEEFDKGPVELDDMIQFGDEETTIRAIVGNAGRSN